MAKEDNGIDFDPTTNDLEAGNEVGTESGEGGPVDPAYQEAVLDSVRADVAAEAIDPTVAAEVAELEAELGVTHTEAAAESSPMESLAGARDLSEFAGALGRMESIADPIAGSITVTEAMKEKVRAMTLDLGQAAGLIKDSGAYGESAQRLVDGALERSSTLPSSLQSKFRQLATDYINGAIAEGKG